MLHSARRVFASPRKRLLGLLLILAVGLPLMIGSLPLQAEGSRDMINDGTSGQGYRAHLEFHATARSGAIPRQTTIKAYAEPGETIYIGSSALGIGQGDVIIRGPRDTTPAELYPIDPNARRCTTRAGGVANYGRILNRAQEVAGPLAPGITDGFIPCVVTADETRAAGAGIWEFDFISPRPDSGLPIPSDPQPILVSADWGNRPNDRTGHWINAWDVSVRNTDAGVDEQVSGRVFANYLALNMGGNATRSRPNLGLFSNFFIQTFDGYGYLVDMNGIDPFAFIFFANNEGIVDQSGAPIYRSIQLAGDNASQRLPVDVNRRPIYRVHNPRLPDDLPNRDITHKIFFDVTGPQIGPAPDLPAVAPSPSGPTWLLRPPVSPPRPENITYTGEEGTPGQGGTNPLGGFFSFTTIPELTYDITVDLNGDGVFGSGNDRILRGPTEAGLNRVYWDGLDGNGQKVAAGRLPFNVQVVFRGGEVHFPFIDAENHLRGHRLLRVVPPPAAGDPDPSTIYYDDRYSFRGGGAYDWSMCAFGQLPPPPADMGVNTIDLPSCYGEAIDSRDARLGTPSIIPSDPSFPGAHRWQTPRTGVGANGYGDRRLIDTWTFFPSDAVGFTSIVTLAEAELAITKSHSPPALTPGGPVTYEVVVTNGGPSEAIGARVRDTVPPQVLNVSWTCAVTTGTGRCGDASGTGNLIETTVDLAPNAAITYTILGTVDPDTEQPIVNTASVRRPRDNTDPNLGNNDDTNIAPVLLSADLELTKSLITPPPLTRNSELEFSIVLRNRGPSRANDVTVTERLPAGLTFVSASPSKGTYAGGLWTVGTMARNEVATLTLRARWDGTIVVNTAEVTNSDKPDPDSTPNNNNPNEDDQSSVPIPALIADLELTKRVNQSRVNVGENAIFTIELTNKGPDGATGVRVNDRLPTGLAFVRATPSQGSFDPISGDWNVGSLARDARATLTIEVTVLGPGPFTNTAQVSASDQFDPDSTPNNDVATEDDQGFATLGGDIADLSIAKRIDNPTPTLNQEITYTVVLRNDGPSNATGIEVTDRVPEGLEYVRHTVSQGTYSPATGLWTVGSVNNGATATLTLTARVRTFARVINTAEVTKSNQPDPDSTPGNNDPNEDDQSSVPLNPQIADLELRKTANTARVVPGGNVEFQIALFNRGPAPATGVQVTDRLPSGLSYVSHVAPAGTTYDPASGIWNVGSIDVNQTLTLTLTARMNGAGPFTNTAEVTSSDQYDPDSTPGNNDPNEDDQSSTEIRSPIADLSVSKRAGGPVPNTQLQTTYTIGVHNAGPDPATGVRVGERLPPGATVLNAIASRGSFAGSEWTVGGLAVNETALLTLTVQLVPPGPYENTVEVTGSDQPDPDSTPNNNDPNEDDQTSVRLPSPVIDLELKKSVAALPKVEDAALFILDLTNLGPDPATGVEVEDKLPPQVAFVSAAPSKGTYDAETGRWTVGAVGVNEVVRLQIAVRLVAPPAEQIVNFAQVTRANEFDVDSTPNNRPGPPPVEDEEASVSFSGLTPVTLKALRATPTAAGVVVAWETGAEFDTAGFYVYRSERGQRAGASRLTTSLLIARGDSTSGAPYSFLDTDAAPGVTYSYWLVEVARGGVETEYGPVTATALTPRVWLPVVAR